MKTTAFKLFFLIFLLSKGGLFAQKIFTKTLGYPEKFSPAVDVSDVSDLAMNEYLSRPSVYSKKDPWLVFNDRENNQTYDKADGKLFKKLKFKEVLYVVSETSGWVELVSGTADGLKLIKDQKYMGWVRKDNLLLWNEGLIDEKTNIHKKALLLNKASEISEVLSQGDKNLVNIYDGPESSNKIENANIYRYFFIFKKENHRYLLAQEYKLSPSNVEIRLLGWVSSARSEVWNTRVALEPNSEEPAYNERKLNLSKFKFVAYADSTAAKAQMKTGIITEAAELWSNDPCVADNSFLNKSNPRRFIGDVIRFPMLTSTNPNIFYSGVIGDIYVAADGSSAMKKIDEKTYLVTKQAARNEEDLKKLVNILFVVEGSAGMAQYKEEMKKLFGEAKQTFQGYENVKVGIVFYRDVSEQRDKRDVEILPLTTNENKFQQFVDGVNFISLHDEDDFSNVRDGIYRGVNEAGLGKNQSNIIIVLGYSPDFSANTARKNGAVAANDPAYHTREDIVESLGAVDASIFFIQCKNNGDVYSDRFKSQAEDILLELAKSDYNKYASVADEIGIITSPSLSDNETANLIRLQNSASAGFAYLAANNASIGSEDVNHFATNAVDSAKTYINGYLKNLITVIEQGKPFASSGPFSHAMAKWLDKEIKREGSILNKDILKSLMGAKYELYKEVYFPYKVQSARFPLVSYVLFMPQEDLSRYIEKLKQVEEAGYASSDNERRTKLFNVFKELIKAFTGNYSAGNEEIGKISINEFQELMNGVQKEGLRLSKEQNFLLSNILDESKMKSSEVDDLIKRILNKLKNLENILRQGKSYEFAFSTEDDVYYWITLDEAF